MYRQSTVDEMLRYTTAKQKGYFCTGLKHGALGTIAEFDQSLPPQEKPTIVPFKLVMERLNA